MQRMSVAGTQKCLTCRERWQVGAREDWRYADLRAKHPRSWWWLSFFAVYLIQARLSLLALHWVHQWGLQ